MERVRAGNPSSIHAAGRAARAAMEEARESVAQLTGVRAEDVVFTSGGTEANALALWGAVYGALDAEARITRIFASNIEHSSVVAGTTTVSERLPGVRKMEIPATADGTIDLEALREMLREGKGRTLVCLMAANNETGVIQPLEAAAKLAREAGALVFVDAVQAAGKIPMGFEADYIAISAHKFGGPLGAGALIVKESAPYAAMIAGGGHERGRRAGTENVAGIAGMGAAAKKAAAFEDIPRQQGLRDRFEAELTKRWTDAIIFGARSPRVCNTSNYGIPGVSAEMTLMALDLDGICVSSGSACSSGKVKSSRVLKAMGIDDELAMCGIRVSFGWSSGEKDVDGLLKGLDKLVARVRPRAAA